jgi:acetyl esterase/lipase
MPLDERARRFLELLAAAAPPEAESLTVAGRRASLAALLRFSGSPEPMRHVETRSVPGPSGPLPVRRYLPLELEATGSGRPGPLGRAGDRGHPTLAYFHGGGMVAGSLDTHEGIARALAHAAGCQVIAIGYRLAPEHRFPAAIDDAIGAVRYLAGHPAEFDLDPARLGVCGDSAGATLATVACQALALAGGPPLALQLLIAPITDYGVLSASRRSFGNGYLLDTAVIEHDLEHYLPPGVAASDPRVSPLRALELRGLPPTVIHTAEFDPVRDEGKAYAERLIEAGIPVSHTCHPGMIHLFYGLATVIPYASVAFEQIGRETRAALC